MSNHEAVNVDEVTQPDVTEERPEDDEATEPEPKWQAKPGSTGGDPRLDENGNIMPGHENDPPPEQPAQPAPEEEQPEQ